AQEEGEWHGLAPPRGGDLRVLALDLLDEEPDEGRALLDLQVHDLAPGPVQVVGQEEHLLAQTVLVYSSDKKWVMSRLALKVLPQLAQASSRMRSIPGAA